MKGFLSVSKIVKFLLSQKTTVFAIAFCLFPLTAKAEVSQISDVSGWSDQCFVEENEKFSAALTDGQIGSWETRWWGETAGSLVYNRGLDSWKIVFDLGRPYRLSSLKLLDLMESKRSSAEVYQIKIYNGAPAASTLVADFSQTQTFSNRITERTLPLNDIVGNHVTLTMTIAENPGLFHPSIGEVEFYGEPVLTWQNPDIPFDVNNDRFITPADALSIIRALNTEGSHLLTTGRSEGEPYYDVNGDNFLSPLDALLVIRKLNQR